MSRWHENFKFIATRNVGDGGQRPETGERRPEGPSLPSFSVSNKFWLACLSIELGNNFFVLPPATQLLPPGQDEPLIHVN